MYFTLQHIDRICRDLWDLVYQPKCPVQKIFWKKGRYNRPEEADADGWTAFGKDNRWGEYDAHVWFKAECTIPGEWDHEKVVLHLSDDLDGSLSRDRQFLLYVDGHLQQGMDCHHQKATVRKEARGKEHVRLDIEAYAGRTNRTAGLYLQLMVENTKIKNLYYDLSVPLQVAAELPEDKTKQDILSVLNQAVNRIDFRQPYSDSFYRSIEEATAFLSDAFYETCCGQDTVHAVCVGHTHIDVAWLWRLEQTREKTARSFSTVLHLMEQYPEYRFMSSQPQLYAFLEDDFPDLFEQIRDRITEGRWEAEGAMWLEADCNLTSGESLVRQIMHGTRYFSDLFGVENKILWLPDVFGYSGALPQIMKQSGIDYFVTTKINWNQYNALPADTFYWEGIDGSQVLTHFITTAPEEDQPSSYYSTYNGVLAPKPIMKGWQRYREKQVHDEILVSYGYGDGGGGPNERMLETGRRMARGIPGCPRVVFGTTRSFFNHLEESIEDHSELKTWVGELYLEYHRGTYTSMARNKRYNRKSELLYHDVETLSALANLLAGQPYPKEELTQNWRTILLNQFHDILPGSSIEPVYADSKIQYEQVTRSGRALIEQALTELCCRISVEQRALAVFNTAGYDRSELVTVPWPKDEPLPRLTCPNHEPALAVQRTEEGFIFFSLPIPAKGYCVVPFSDSNDETEPAAVMSQIATLSISKHHIENRFFAIDINEKGQFSRIYDKTNQREVLKDGHAGNVLRVFEDKPMNYSNWDIDLYYQQKSWEIDTVTSIDILEEGPVRAALKITWSFLSSTLTQIIYLYDQLPRIDFDTVVDWKESELLLKTEFPVDIHADVATYDIQFGNVTRPTHWNTSWDWARFEVCAHKWADLSEEGYGVSLLNDCKYGHDIHGSNMRLTLIKCGTAPNPQADRERHHFTYALFPHMGTWRQGGTMQQAYNVNMPLYARLIDAPQEGKWPASWSLCHVDAFEHVMVETVKQAEDQEGLIIRLFEFTNWRGPVKLTFGPHIQKAESCDLMEQAGDPIEPDEETNSITFTIHPYEIKTFRVHLEKNEAVS